MLQLKDFQQQAASQIAERFLRYNDNPSVRGPQKSQRKVPFFQALASITASGKTVILADTVAAISSALPIAPVVLWLSKGRIVVEQTYVNLSPGGRYHHLLGAMGVATLAEYDANTVRDATQPLLYFATVGTFNQKDKEDGDRLIFKTDIEDTADQSVWQALTERLNDAGQRRPMLVVYDEAQNLSDQQTDLLLELQPDAFIVASATMRIPVKLSEEIKALKSDGWTDEELITHVAPADVVEAGLIKSTVLMAGYEAPMEETIDSMLGDYADALSEAATHGLAEPKCIYVCKTNIVEGDAFRRDDPKRPFDNREAPPIVIWRYLTDHHGVDPEKIAVYTRALKFDKNYPAPAEFALFAGGDTDYERFVSGDFTHVIFNLSLQEGWDDPLAYFAYIDKSMESNVAIEQVIGRLLRQPQGQHFSADRLNTAHFYVRVDDRGVFKEVMDQVTEKLEQEAPEVRLIEASPGKPKPVPYAPRQTVTVHETGYNTRDAVAPCRALLGTISDWRQDTSGNTTASGGRALVQRNIGQGGAVEFVWEEFEHTNKVSARWIFQREVLRRFPGALGVALADDGKFDALIGFNSSAYHQVVNVARQVVDTYIDNVVLRQKRLDPYGVGAVLVRPDDIERFDNSVHEGYSELNKLEKPFAKALDRTARTWCRNPSRSGYGIPLITLGRTRTFYPDFLVWLGDDVFALDTTAPHLLADKTTRKLLSIDPPKGAAGRLYVRFISPGQWNSDVEELSCDGYTVWSLKQGNALRAAHVADLDKSIEQALKPV